MQETDTIFCLFIGYPRSGHSLIGALLDAHPNMAIAHEVNVLERFMEGEDRHRIFYRIIAACQVQASCGRMSDEYSYAVPDSWQGKFTQLKVIGDKKGGGTTGLLANNPQLLVNFRQEINMPLRFIHVWRNPFDNITTMLLRAQKAGENKSLDTVINEYLALARANARLRFELKGELFEISHEDFVSAPEEKLKRICLFLGIEPDENYLKNCASIVYKSTTPSRNKIDWPREKIEEVMTRKAEFDFLAEYTFGA